MTALSPLRRVTLCVVAVTFAALLFRAQIADAVATRGDALFAAGDLAAAARYYERAAVLDPASPVAAERYTTLALESRRRAVLLRAVAIAQAELRHNPRDGIVRQNLGLVELKLGRKRAARDDLRRAAPYTHDANVIAFVARLDARR